MEMEKDMRVFGTRLWHAECTAPDTRQSMILCPKDVAVMLLEQQIWSNLWHFRERRV